MPVTEDCHAIRRKRPCLPCLDKIVIPVAMPASASHLRSSHTRQGEVGSACLTMRGLYQPSLLLMVLGPWLFDIVASLYRRIAALELHSAAARATDMQATAELGPGSPVALPIRGGVFPCPFCPRACMQLTLTDRTYAAGSGISLFFDWVSLAELWTGTRLCLTVKVAVGMRIHRSAGQNESRSMRQWLTAQ